MTKDDFKPTSAKVLALNAASVRVYSGHSRINCKKCLMNTFDSYGNRVKCHCERRLELSWKQLGMF